MSRTTEFRCMGVLLMALSACAQPDAADRAARETSVTALADTRWTVEQLGAESGSALATLTLHFTGSDRVSGHDGCNSFGGAVSIKGPAINISSNLAVTMMACPEAVDIRARNYRAALLQATQFRISGNRLELRTASGTLVASLSRSGGDPG